MGVREHRLRTAGRRTDAIAALLAGALALGGCTPKTPDAPRPTAHTQDAAKTESMPDEPERAASPSAGETGEVASAPQVSDPVPVDLRDLPETPPSRGLREAPAPGLPDPLPKLVRRVQEDLARRLGVDVDDLEVVTAEPVDWPDAALGCPEPGGTYAQVVTPGYRIVLRAAGREHPYHTRGTEHFVACDVPPAG